MRRHGSRRQGKQIGRDSRGCLAGFAASATAAATAPGDNRDAGLRSQFKDLRLFTGTGGQDAIEVVASDEEQSMGPTGGAGRPVQRVDAGLWQSGIVANRQADATDGGCVGRREARGRCFGHDRRPAIQHAGETGFLRSRRVRTEDTGRQFREMSIQPRADGPFGIFQKQIDAGVSDGHGGACRREW